MLRRPPRSTLSLHDALPICFDFTKSIEIVVMVILGGMGNTLGVILAAILLTLRSEEHTSELQSRPHLVCRLLLEKKNARLLSYQRIGLVGRTLEKHCRFFLL